MNTMIFANRLTAAASQAGITAAEASAAFQKLAAGEIAEVPDTVAVTILQSSAERGKRCAYCGVLSEKICGTCDHCGAPL